MTPETIETALYALNRRSGELRRRRDQFPTDAFDRTTPRALDRELSRIAAAHAELAVELERIKRLPASWLKGIAPTGNRQRAKIHAVTADRVAACGTPGAAPFPSGVPFDPADELACRECVALCGP